VGFDVDKIRVGLIGSGFISAIHHESLSRIPGVEVVAVASPSPQRSERFASERGIPHAFRDVEDLLGLRAIDLVIVGVPNHLHHDITIQAAEAGKHVVVEKPMALNVAQCDRMIEACRRAGVILGYAEELCFAPKYVRVKELVDQGALGQIHLVKQSEKHDGPHSGWFYDIGLSGGGVTFDMGCHAIEFFRWIFGANSPGGKAQIANVYAQMGTYVHGEKTQGDDESILILNFEGGGVGLAEESWTKPGGMDDRVEVFGSEGQVYADLLYGNSLRTYSRRGYAYAVEKAGDTSGWTFPVFEEIWNYGFPQEMEHFISCIRDGKTPRENGEDGRAVVEAIHALYESARRGSRVELPFESPAMRPIDLWKAESRTL
jgi:predicted dehydrogenase